MNNDDTLQSRPLQDQSPEEGDKASNLVAGMPVPDIIEYLPAHFAIKKLRKHKYIELSYFMPEGRTEGANNESIFSSEIFTLAKEDDILLLKPIINFKGLKSKVTQDEDLSWDQLCILSTNFLKNIIQEGCREHG